MALSITIPGGAVQLAGTQVRVNVNTTQQQGSLYRVLLKVLNTDGKLDGMPQIEENQPDINGDATFNIEGLLYRNFIPEFNAFARALCTVRPNIPCSIAFDVGESYIDDNSQRQENWAGLNGPQYQVSVLQGGLAEYEKNQYNELGTNWYTDFIVGGKWLTTLVNGQKISPTSPVKLWFITHETAVQNLTLHVSYTLADGTVQTLNQPVNIEPTSMHELDVDVLTLGLPTEGNKVLSYTLQLQKNGAPLPDTTHTFKVDYTWYEFNTYVFATNKYGGVDPYWFTGKVTNLFPVEHTTAQRASQPTDTSKHRTRIVASKSGRRTWDVNTGHKSYAEIMALENLLLGRQLWLVYNNKLIPVNIENSEEVLACIANNLHSFSIRFIEAHETRY